MVARAEKAATWLWWLGTCLGPAGGRRRPTPRVCTALSAHSLGHSRWDGLPGQVAVVLRHSGVCGSGLWLRRDREELPQEAPGVRQIGTTRGVSGTDSYGVNLRLEVVAWGTGE